MGFQLSVSISLRTFPYTSLPIFTAATFEIIIGWFVIADYDYGFFAFAADEITLTNFYQIFTELADNHSLAQIFSLLSLVWHFHSLCPKISNGHYPSYGCMAWILPLSDFLCNKHSKNPHFSTLALIQVSLESYPITILYFDWFCAWYYGIGIWNRLSKNLKRHQEGMYSQFPKTSIIQ